MTTQTTHTAPTRPDTQAAPAASGSRGAWTIVAAREVMAKLTDKSFVISTIVSVLMIVGIMLFQMWFLGRPTEFKVAVTDARAAAAVEAAGATIAANPLTKDTIVPVEVADAAAARAALEADEVRAWLEPGASGWTLTYFKDASTTLDTALPAAVRDVVLTEQLAPTGQSLDALTAGAAVTTQLVQGDAERSRIAMAVGFVFAILFLMSALGFGIQIATSVVEEKQNRIVEILASAIPTTQLLAGKIVGNTIMALGQMVLYVAVGLLGLSFTEFSTFVPALSESAGWYIAFFLAGFLALACVWAGTGAMASRQEDIGNTTMPLMMILMVAYFAAFMAEGVWRTALSYVPVVSSIIMPVRLFEGDAQWWDAALALGANLAFAAFTIWLGARLYRSSLLQVNGMVSLRDALRGPR